MHRLDSSVSMCALFALILSATAGRWSSRVCAEEPTLSAERISRWQNEGLPLIHAYCIDCHNEDLQEGGLDLSPLESLTNFTAPEINRVLEMVRFGAMPPEDAEEPEVEERKTLANELERLLFSADCDLQPRAGRVTVRRLNRSEYNRSVRDLFGVDLRPADDFPSDEVGAGFDNNANVLTMSSMLIEKYFDAAEAVARAAVIDPRSLPRLSVDVPADQIPIYGKPEIGRFAGRYVDRESFAWVDFKAPYDGYYRVSVRGGATSKNSDPIRVAIYDETGTLRAVDELKYFGGGGSSQSIRRSFELTKGDHRLAIVPVLDDSDLTVDEATFDDVTKMDPGEVKRVLAELGNPVSPARSIDSESHPFMFRHLQVEGPSKHPQSAFPPKQFQLVRHTAPRRGNGYRDVRPTAVKNLRPMMRDVFRGPVTDEEVNAYAGLVEKMTREGQSFHRGMQVAISALLVSPRFLYRNEEPPADADVDDFGNAALTQHQLASRLSYFLWSSTPDKTLLDLADRGGLNEQQLKSQVFRMLKDPRADSLAGDFAAQWLGLRNLYDHEADQDKFPGYGDELRTDMVRETEMLFLHIVRNNLPVREFLTADYSFLNRRLARHYGIDSESDDFTKVAFSEAPRRGLLSHGSILTLTSTPTRTSPVLRGKWILENILGVKPPEPPAGVPDLDETEAAADNATLREQLELHRQSASCASCHKVMDQLGFGLDDFDAVGQYRTEDNGKPIDSSGLLPDGRAFRGGVALTNMLGETESEALARTLIERLLTFALGRELTPDDRCTVDEIAEQTQSDQYRLADLIVGVVNSRPFRFQTIDKTEEKP